MKKIKKITKTQLKAIEQKRSRKALKDWAEACRKLGHCEKCGKIGLLNAHHVISRTFAPLRIDPRNACCLCASCHLFGAESAHKGSLMFLEWFKSVRKEDYDYLLGVYLKNKKV